MKTRGQVEISPGIKSAEVLLLDVTRRKSTFPQPLRSSELTRHHEAVGKIRRELIARIDGKLHILAPPPGAHREDIRSDHPQAGQPLFHLRLRRRLNPRGARIEGYVHLADRRREAPLDLFARSLADREKALRPPCRRSSPEGQQDTVSSSEPAGREKKGDVVVGRDHRNVAERRHRVLNVEKIRAVIGRKPREKAQRERSIRGRIHHPFDAGMAEWDFDVREEDEAESGIFIQQSRNQAGPVGRVSGLRPAEETGVDRDLHAPRSVAGWATAASSGNVRVFISVRLNYGFRSGAIMKKRKFPAGLIVALVVLLGGAGAYSLINTKAANMSPEEANQVLQEEAMREAAARAPQQPANATPPTMTKDQVRSQVGATTRAGGPPGGPEGGPRRPEGARGAPGSSIMAPKSVPYKPVPNESATSSQWFNKK